MVRQLRGNPNPDPTPHPDANPDQVRQLQRTADPNPNPNPDATPEQVRQLQGTDVDADTAQRVLDDTTQLGIKAAQADEQQRRAQEVRTA